MVGLGASLFSECLFQPLWKARDLEKEVPRLYPHKLFHRKALVCFSPWVGSQTSLSTLLCASSPGQLCMLGLAESLGFSRSVSFADGGVWWAGHALMWTGVWGL